MEKSQLEPQAEAVYFDEAETPVATDTVASVFFGDSDHIRVTRLPRSAVRAIREEVQRLWAEGIQSENTVYETTDFKLKGIPFPGLCSARGHQLIIPVLSALWRLGWSLELSSCTSGSVTRNARTLYFSYRAAALPACEWLLLAWEDNKKLRTVNANFNLLRSLGEILDPISEKQGTHRQLSNTHQWDFSKQKLSSSVARDADALQSSLRCDILQVLKHESWSFLQAGNIGSTGRDLWIFQKPE